MYAMAAEHSSLQWILRGCRDHLRQIWALAKCSAVPCELLQSLLADTPALARRLCAAIDYDADGLSEAGMCPLQRPIPVRKVILPPAFEVSLSKAISAIPNTSTRNTTQSLAQWGRRIVQLAVLQSSFYVAVADGILDGIAGKRLAVDDAEKRRGSHDGDLSINLLPGTKLYPMTDSEAQPNISILTIPVTVAEEVLLPTRQGFTVSETSSHSDNMQCEHPTQALVSAESAATSEATPTEPPLSTDHTGTHTTMAPSDMQDMGGIMVDGGNEGSSCLRQVQTIESALDRYRMPYAESSQVHETTYGEVSADKSNGLHVETITDDTSGHLELLVSGRGEQAAFSILDAHERGYEAVPLSFARMQELCVQVLGAISVQGTAENGEIRTCVIAPTIDMVNIKRYFAHLFEELVDEAFGRLLLYGAATSIDDISLEKLRKLGTGRAESLLSKRVVEKNAFDPSSFANLLRSEGSGSNPELKGSAKRSAKLMANKPAPHARWHEATIAVLNRLVRSSTIVSAVFGPAGTGKSTMVSKIRGEFDTSFVNRFPEPAAGYSYTYHCEIFDFSRPHEISRLRIWIDNTRNRQPDNLKYKRVRFCIIDECTFFDPDGFELLSELDYVVFVGDPRQMGAVDNAHLIRRFVTLAGGTNQLLNKIHRRIHPSLFDALNELAYGGNFYLAERPQIVVHDQYQVAKCQDVKFCIAASMLCMAFYNAADKKEVCIATQDGEIIELMEALIGLDPRAYQTLTAHITFIPLSRIQGIETDVLVINPAEIDKFCCDIAGTLKFLFVVLGRVRQHLAIVQPIRMPVPLGSNPPPFSFLLHALLGQTPSGAQQG